MKEITMDPLPAGSAEKESFANRKLIRPTLPRVESHGNHNPAAMPVQRERTEKHDRPDHASARDHAAPRAERHDRPAGGGGGGGKKPVPAEQTHAENFYYQKQMQSQTPMVVVLRDGEEIRGVIEWYDRNCIKVLRNHGEPNLMIYKPAIKYMYKEGENER
jgi:sRNA-binding regulator protein Hfq